MRLCILVYDGIDLWDLAFPYDVFNKTNGVEIDIISKNGGEITLKDKTTVIGGTKPMRTVRDIDVLWVCQGETEISALLKDDIFKIQLARLSDEAEKVVIIGSSSMLFDNIMMEEDKIICAHPCYEKSIKRSNKYNVDNLFFAGEKFITSSARLSCIYAVLLVIEHFFSAKVRGEVFSYYNFDTNLILKFGKTDEAKRYKKLKKLYKKTMKRKSSKEKLSTVDNEDAICIYLIDEFESLSLAIIFSILSNYEAYDIYFIGEGKRQYFSVDSGFYLRTSHSINDVKNLSTLIFTGSYNLNVDKVDKVTLIRLGDIINKSDKVLSLCESSKLVNRVIKMNPAIDESKIMSFQNIGNELDWIKNNLDILTNEYYAELLLSEYY